MLVDRLWPRGITKQAAALTAWLRDLAPSNELRLWYHSHPKNWGLFRRRYLKELRSDEATAALQELYSIVDAHKAVTLVFASRLEERNNAVVLKELLEGTRKPPASSGPLRAAAKSQRARAPRR